MLMVADTSEIIKTLILYTILNTWFTEVQRVFGKKATIVWVIH